MVKTILLSLLLVGCASGPIKTQIVDVPVNVCSKNVAKVIIPQKPDLMINHILPTDGIGEIAKDYKLTVKQLQQYSDELMQAIGGIKDACQ